MASGPSIAGDERQLATFLRKERDAIVAAWEKEARRLPVAQGLSRPLLLDHIPRLLDSMAEVADVLARGFATTLAPEEAGHHAVSRIAEGYDLTEVFAEYTLLRRCIVQQWSENGDAMPGRVVALLDESIDQAIAVAIEDYGRARDRTLESLDRISAVALETRDLDELLRRLLMVLVETTAAVDTAAIVIRDGTLLRVRAAFGLEREAETGFTMAIGEGFAGGIAASRRPHLLRDAANAPPEQLKSRILRQKKVRALYGVPLVSGEELVGVAHIGSLTAYDFSEQDKHVFRAAVARATLAIDAAMIAARDRAASAAARALGGAGSLDEAIPALLAEIGGAFAWDVGGYWRRDADGVLRCQHTWSATGSEVDQFERTSCGMTLRAGEGLPGRALETGATVWVPDVTRDPNFPRLLAARRQGLRSGIAIPLRLGERAGALELFSRSERLPTGETFELTRVLDSELQRFAQRVAAQERLKEEQAQKAAMLDASLDCIVSMDATGRIVAWNPAAARTFGYSAEEAIGQELAALIIPERLRDGHRRGLQRYLATGRQQYLDRRLDMPALRRDGSEFPVELTITQVRGQVPPLFTGFIRDLTEQRRAEATDRFLHDASEALSRTIEYDAALDQTARLAVPFLCEFALVDVVEENGAVRRVGHHADPARESIVRALQTRYPARPESPLPTSAVLSSGMPLLVPEVTDAFITVHTYDALHAGLGRALELRSLLCVPLIAGDRTIGALCLHATTPRRFSERDVPIAQEFARRASSAIERARLFREAQQAVRLREQVLAIVSHDLKTPLNVVHMAASLLAKKASDPKARHQIETISRAATRMKHLINDLLDVASIQAARLRVSPEPHDVADIVREALDLHTPFAVEKRIALRSRLELDGARALCDRDRVLQVLTNLLGNALKFCSAGCSVELSAQVRGQVVELAVADDGPGIPEDELPRLFDPWWSAGRYATRGTGLGLFISRGIVEAHGGELRVESRPGSGATFTFTLPLAG